MGTRTHECPRQSADSRLNFWGQYHLAVVTSDIKRLPEPRLVHHFMKLKSQLNVRLAPVCMDLIKLERKNIPGCASDGEALESIIFRAATSPEARQLITQAALKEPLYAAAQLAWEAEHAKRKS